MSLASRRRQDQILQRMLQQDAVSVQELSDAFSVSSATIRRDLRTLKERGMLMLTHGGAKPKNQSLYDGMLLDSSFEDQLRRNVDEKRRIGVAAAKLVENDSVISLTPGTTSASVGRSILNRTGVTVVVSAINIAMELSAREDLRVFIPGGYMRPNWFSLIGPSTLFDIRQFLADVAFIGVVGIDAERGLFSGNHDEAAVNRMMIENARRRVVVADHTKLGAVSAARIAEIDVVDTLITGVEASDEAIAPFANRGIEVRRV